MPISHFNIFISHIHEEQVVAHALKEKIESVFLGAVRVFVSSHEQDVRLGDDWFEEVEQRLANAEIVLLLLSPMSVSRPWVNFEAGAAWFSDKRIIPICSEELAVDELPPPFNKRQTLVLSEAGHLQKLFNEIAAQSGLRAPTADDDEPIVYSSTTIELSGETQTDGDIEKSQGGLSHYPSSQLFEWRFGDAFPGLRDIEVITDPSMAIDRLSIVLADPLYREPVESNNSRSYPFWWFRGSGSMYIKQFKRLSHDTCLVGYTEFKINRLVAVRRFDDGERDFIYLEGRAQEPTGVYDYSHRTIEERLEEKIGGEFERDYQLSEEYGLWNGYPVSREEYDDGSALIDGRPTRIENTELRIRFLTSHNTIICAKKHVINNTNDTDAMMRSLLNNVLLGESSVTDLIDKVSKLPRNPLLDRGLI